MEGPHGGSFTKNSLPLAQKTPDTILPLDPTKIQLQLSYCSHLEDDIHSLHVAFMKDQFLV